MKKSLFIFFLATFLFIDFITYGQVWNEANGYNGIGRHHPITVANDNYGYMIAKWKEYMSSLESKRTFNSIMYN